MVSFFGPIGPGSPSVDDSPSLLTARLFGFDLHDSAFERTPSHPFEDRVAVVAFEDWVTESESESDETLVALGLASLRSELPSPMSPPAKILWETVFSRYPGERSYRILKC